MLNIIIGTTPTITSYLDLNTQTPPLRYIDALRTAYTLSGDGIHPNADGYRLFYVPKITAWMKGL